MCKRILWKHGNDQFVAVYFYGYENTENFSEEVTDGVHINTH